ncbi:MAG: hypothetical protein HN820_02720 [Candidatus Marinimicrobia bacterium]|jgi:hypothetical protein|nr:hypothetical protein [Candidatus Neomarinimicrobiota bacterium]MBT5955663.1 hypothetical protein [Candidatus Neomarinimicrobiota bacterium]MBT6870346.1 hypothetical protein [Candidatus Neomarinimicrobiota bacterium]MBT7377050.1 hypothetical protein [Candidatus Neomarinimicrobiota bacterium]|tara:strand:- start:318 stop:701 length:384 start_codon:yes stop_codon:yes gene_type:complete
MSNFFQTIKKHPKTISTIFVIGLIIYLMLKLELDVRAIAIITLVVGYITNVFAGISILTASIPIIGPIIVNLFAIPFFWMLNLTGYFTSVVAIKKGYGKTVMSHRIVTLTLLSGIIIGYILGHLIPV